MGNFFFEKMKLAFLLFGIAQVFAEEALAPGDTGGTEAVFAKDELPPFDWQPMKEPKVESLLEVVDSKPSPGDTKTHKAEFFQEFKLDEEDDSEEEEEASDLVEVDGKLAEDDTEKHEELYDDEETIDDYEGLVSEDGEMSPGDDGDHELIEAETKEKSRDLSVEEEIEDEGHPKPSLTCDHGDCPNPTPPQGG